MFSGRDVQGAIYGAGVFGRKPAVPTDGARLEEAARRRMSAEAFAYVAGSAGSEATARANREAFAAYPIVPTMLTDTRERDCSTTLLGRRHASPLLVAPIGVLSMAHAEADLAVARAARRAQVGQVISTQASTPMEDIAAALRGEGSSDDLGDGPGHWYQLYWPNDDELAESLVRRAEASGAGAIVLTLDTGNLGWRPRDLDLGWLPFARGMGIAQYTSDPVFQRLVAERVAGTRGGEGSGAQAGARAERQRPTPAAVRALITMSRNHPGELRANLTSPEPRAAVETFLDVFPNLGLTWESIGRLREWTSLPVLLKGIQSVDDALRAVDAGVDGVWVSNHGGRQVDRAVASLDALAAIAPRVRERSATLPIVFDSGIRTGADAFVALALGASAVAIGRPHVYGLALAGEEGVVEVLRNIRAELDLTMALSGCRTLDDITPERLAFRA